MGSLLLAVSVLCLTEALESVLCSVHIVPVCVGVRVCMCMTLHVCVGVVCACPCACPCACVCMCMALHVGGCASPCACECVHVHDTACVWGCGCVWGAVSKYGGPSWCIGGYGGGDRREPVADGAGTTLPFPRACTCVPLCGVSTCARAVHTVSWGWGCCCCCCARVYLPF